MLWRWVLASIRIAGHPQLPSLQQGNLDVRVALLALKPWQLGWTVEVYVVLVCVCVVWARTSFMNVSISSGALWALHPGVYARGGHTSGTQALGRSYRVPVLRIHLVHFVYHEIACLVERQYPLGIAVVGSPLGFPNLAPVVPGRFGALIRLD